MLLVERWSEMRVVNRVFVVVLLATAGCGGADTAEGDIFTVTQADDGCTVSGPTEVPAGQTYYFIVKNPTALGTDLYVSRLTDGKTFQDIVEPQTYPGEYYPKPSWVVYAKGEYALAREFKSATEVDDDDRVEAFSVEPGPHAIYTYTGGSLWFCGPLQVK